MVDYEEKLNVRETDEEVRSVGHLGSG